MLIVDNWCFVRDRLKKKKFLSCTPSDCAVAIKLSSSDFRPRKTDGDDEEEEKFVYDDEPDFESIDDDEDEASGRSSEASRKSQSQKFFFDKYGAVLPYGAFLSLMNDKDFSDGYMKKIYQKYLRDVAREENEGGEPADVPVVISESPPAPPPSPPSSAEAEEPPVDPSKRRRKK